MQTLVEIEKENENEVELEFYSTWKYNKYFIYDKEKVVSAYYHTLLVREWIEYQKKKDLWIKDEIVKKIKDSNLLDIEISFNVLSFVNGKNQEFYDIENMRAPVFDSFELAIYYLAQNADSIKKMIENAKEKDSINKEANND